MIRLFRKIRRQLLSEKRYSIYILYATGEILLVVIGILLALQIDNWNENRKQDHQISSIRNSLSADLARDTLLFNQKLQLMISDTIQLGDYAKRMSHAKVTMDSLVQIARFEFNPHIHATVSFNSTRTAA